MVAPCSSKQLSCERCSRPHAGTYGSSRFCSVRCAKQVGAAARRAAAMNPATVAAMLPVPTARPRPIPLRSPVPSAATLGSSSPPRKKAARSDSPTTIAIAINAKPTASSAPIPPPLRLRCESCDKPHDGSYGSGRFCAVHCARRTAAALKWSKKRASRSNRASTSSSSLSAPVASAAAVPTSSTLPTLAMVHPSAVLPPLPPDDLSLGKRSHPSVVAPLPHPHPHVFPFPYAPPPCTTHAIMQPHFANSYPYTTAPMGRPTAPLPQPRLGEPTHQQPRLSPSPYPISYPMPIPIAVPVANCYGYPPATVPVPYGAPYVPVHYGPVGVPSVAHSTSPIMSSSVSISQTSRDPQKKEYRDSAAKEEPATGAVTVKASDDSGAKEGSEKTVKKEDSAEDSAAAEVLMSMFSTRRRPDLE